MHLLGRYRCKELDKLFLLRRNAENCQKEFENVTFTLFNSFLCRQTLITVPGQLLRNVRG